jgi:nitroreductase
MSRTAELTAAVEHALRAPSVHNTQPWQWRIRADALELHADWDRHLMATDPDRRDLVISCGAALHHLEVALAARGLAVQVRRMPARNDRGHLATVAVRSGRVDAVDAEQFLSIDRRRTDRRRMSHQAVPAEHLLALTEQARRTGTLLMPVTGTAMRQRLTATLTEAAHRQEFAPGYAAELRQWTQRYALGHDGVSAASVAPVPVGLLDASPLRLFPRAQLPQPRPSSRFTSADDAAELLVIVTAHDDPLDWLRAGETLSAVLLAATGLGLATTPLSQALEVDETRHALRWDVLRVPEHPQLVVRVGWPATGAAELPVTPRRDLRSVLLSTEPSSHDQR